MVSSSHPELLYENLSQKQGKEGKKEGKREEKGRGVKREREKEGGREGRTEEREKGREGGRREGGREIRREGMIWGLSSPFLFHTAISSPATTTSWQALAPRLAPPYSKQQPEFLERR